MKGTEAVPGILSPGTSYFEIDSDNMGDRYAIWVTTPPNYERKKDQSYPVIYVTDGNTNALLTAAASFLLLGDNLRPMRPFIQVSIGFANANAGERIVKRSRDFSPPGEPPSERLERMLSRPPYSRAIGEEGLIQYAYNLRNGRADSLLAFIEDELHPEIGRRFRLEPGEAALYGHSQGGLFTLYAMVSGCRLFNTYGAGSPGVIVPDSRIYSLYERMVEQAREPARQIRLHLVANDLEMMGPVELYRAVGGGFVRLIDLIRQKPLPGLHMTSAVTIGETHFSGVFDAYRSFLRACFSRQEDR